MTDNRTKWGPIDNSAKTDLLVSCKARKHGQEKGKGSMRGFFSGLVWGIVVVAALAGLVSLLSSMPSGPEVATNAPSGGASKPEPEPESGMRHTGTDADLVDAAPTVPGGETGSPDSLRPMDGADTDPANRPEVGGDGSSLSNPGQGGIAIIATPVSPPPAMPGMAPSGPDAGQDAPDNLGSMQQADTAPTSAPKVGDAGGALGDPGAASSGANVAVDSDTPVAPPPVGAIPSAPSDDRSVALSQDPARPVALDISESGSGFGNAAPVAEATPDIATQGDVTPVVGSPADSVSQPAGETTPAPSTDPSQTAQTAPDSGVLAQTPAAPRVAALPQAGSGDTPSRQGGVGTRVVPLTDRNQTANAEPVADLIPPIILHGEPFSNSDGKPLMAIVLIDGEHSIGAEALANFPQPLTIAVDPSAPDAAEKMARHRAAGFEVVALVDLPVSATAQDAEVSLAASFAEMPEVVAILEGPGTGIQGNRALADQVSAIVAGSGHGLIMQDNGLNTVYKLSVRAGVHAGVVFRDFDGAGQSGTVMRRFLDQAAFRAGQEGAVIMLGRVQPETVSALLLWALQDRATRVALAPVSAVLSGSQE